jgi:hypothetical protein
MARSEALYHSNEFSFPKSVDIRTKKVQKYKLDQAVRGLGPDGDVNGLVVAILADNRSRNPCRGSGIITCQFVAFRSPQP